MTRRRGRAIVPLAGLVAMVLLTGCVQEVPMVSAPRTTSTETLYELRVWAAEQADAAIAAAGVPTGWLEGDIGVSELHWAADSTDRLRILAGLFPTSCGGSDTGRLYLGLRNPDERSDSFAVADRVWAFWEAQGWTVRYVIEPNDRERYFRADRADGGMLSFRAAENWLVLSIHTNCSMHSTVVRWELHRGEPNPLLEEIHRREQSSEE